jgi:hypothetical protein
MKWPFNRFLLWPYFTLVLVLLTIGCSSKEDPEETLSVSGNHSTGDLVMVTTDTSSDGYHYLDPELSPDRTRVMFTADWYALPSIPRYTGDDDFTKFRQIIVMPMQVGLEPALSLEAQGAQLVVLQETAIRIGGATVFLSTVKDDDKGHPLWVDDQTIIFWLNLGIGKRLFQADISDIGSLSPIVPVYFEDSDNSSAPPFRQHMEAALSPQGDWLLFTRSGCVNPREFETCTGVSIYALDMSTLGGPTGDGYGALAFPITNEYSRIEAPSWSPDGRSITFSGGLDVGGSGTGAGTEIFTMDFDTTGLDAGTMPLDRNVERVTFTELAAGDPISGVFNTHPRFNEDGNQIYFTSTRRAPTTTLHDRNIWVVPADGSIDPEIFYFTRSDDVDPYYMGDGRILLSSMLGFPSEMLIRLEEETYQRIFQENVDQNLGLDEVQMRALAAEEIRNLTFFEGVMSHIYTFRP